MNLKNKILDHMMKVKYIPYVPPSKATGKVAEVYKAANKEFGFAADPIVVHSHIPELLELFYDLGRETLLVAGKIPRVAKEAMIAAVSKTNQCPYCVDAHSIIVNSLDDPAAVKAIQTENYALIENEKLRSLIEWAAHNRDPRAAIIARPPFSREEAPEVIGAVVLFQYINRIVNVFVKGSQVPDGIMRGLFQQMGKKMMVPFSSQKLKKGNPVQADELNRPFGWALPDKGIAGRFALFDQTVEKLGKEFIPDQTRLMLQKELEGWHGEEKPLSRSWLNEKIAAVSDSHKPAAKLALLSAQASYQVDENVIDDFRKFNSSDKALLSTVCWSAWRTAKRMADWLGRPFADKKT